MIRGYGLLGWRLPMTVVLYLLLIEGSVGAQEVRAVPFAWDSTLSSAGATLTLEETNRVVRPTFHSVFYRLRAVGFQVGQPVSLWVRRWNRVFRFPAWLDEQGLVRFVLDRDTLGEVLTLGFRRDHGLAIFRPGGGGTRALLLAGFADGQPLEVALVSDSAPPRAQARVVPIPRRAEGPGGCSAAAEVLSETGLVYRITFRGFQPTDTVRNQSHFRSEVLNATGSSATGEFMFPVLFGNGDRGTASVTASGASCSVRLEYSVGRDALVR
jgi:hypothetical protein